MDAIAFCPQCGTRRHAGMSFCGTCGYEFAGGAPADPATRGSPNGDQPVSEPSIEILPALAGIAWLVAAAAMALLAFRQWDAALGLIGVGGSDGGLRQSAVFNGLAALVSAYLGVRCLDDPGPGVLSGSAGWGLLNVLWAIIQVASGATYWLFFLILMLGGLAAVLSAAARESSGRGFSLPLAGDRVRRLSRIGSSAGAEAGAASTTSETPIGTDT